MKPITRQWVRKAEADWLLATIGSRSKTPLYDGVCFHCQQCAEKNLKALLVELGITVPRTHNLVDLFALLLPHHSALKPLKRGLVFLTDFAVETRYPGEDASKRQAASALHRAEHVRKTCRTILGIKPSRRRRKRR